MNLARFDLNLLRVLDALLTEGTTVKAAARLGLSQPAVSAALGRLRHALEDDLFLRRGQGMEPTDYARSLALPLHKLLQGVDTMLEGPKAFDPSTANETFRISGSDFYAELLMPRLAEMVSRLAPGVRVHMVGLLPSMQLETYESYGIDILLAPGTQVEEWTDHQPVLSSRFVVVARKDHPRFAGLTEGEVVPIDLYCDLGHVLFSSEGNPSALGDKALARVGRKRRVVMTLPFFSGVYRAVGESDLIALMPHQIACRIAPRMGLRVFAPPMPIDEVHHFMFWHKRSTSMPGHRWLRDLIADILRPLDDRNSCG